MRITAEMLRKAEACTGDIEAFEKQWPDGCEVTRENCEIAFGELGMAADFAARHLLPPEARKEYRRLHEDMLKACVNKAAAGCKCREGEIELFYQAAKGAKP